MPNDKLIAHYSSWPDYERIVESLRRQTGGRDLRTSDFFPYDQSHAGGIEATAKLAATARIGRGSTVIDIGCGVGGAARYLRSEFGSRVFGLDLTASRLVLANTFSQLTGLHEGIAFAAADASILPLPDRVADFVWTQHVTMNLPNLPGLLSEAFRVLKPGGTLAMHEWFIAPEGVHSGDLPLPLPWAPEAAINRIGCVGAFVSLLQQFGFAASAFEDVTAEMIERLRLDLPKQEARGAPASRIASQRNLEKCASQGLLICVMIVAAKPG